MNLYITSVLALSVDNVASHKEWIEDIEETQTTKLNYPILADRERKVSDLCNTIHPNADNTLTVRSVRSSLLKKAVITTYLSANTSCNFDEISRVIDSIQLTENY